MTQYENFVKQILLDELKSESESIYGLILKSDDGGRVSHDGSLLNYYYILQDKFPNFDVKNDLYTKNYVKIIDKIDENIIDEFVTISTGGYKDFYIIKPSHCWSGNKKCPPDICQIKVGSFYNGSETDRFGELLDNLKIDYSNI